ncbi:hypothetical protein SBA3_4330003 [Candidatus Sulfopaludibacter sp. SbA3]|nr:hypothetical protein SBA3_4330003 [Candidatus Sulfopaludibacter sp. SbA3]
MASGWKTIPARWMWRSRAPSENRTPAAIRNWRSRCANYWRKWARSKPTPASPHGGACFSLPAGRRPAFPNPDAFSRHLHATGEAYRTDDRILSLLPVLVGHPFGTVLYGPRIFK